jgi:hypothetical protein
MPRNNEPKWRIEELADEEIFDRIRYLDPDTNCKGSGNDDTTVQAICFSLAILLYGYLAFVWIYGS